MRKIIGEVREKPDSIGPLIDQLKYITGIKFEYYRTDFLEKRIKFRMKNLNLTLYSSYLNYMLANPKEIDYFLDKFTVNYTYFFRNYEIFEKLKEILLFSNKESKRPLRIWSAPCASGEEPYSIAMLLDQVKQIYPNFPNYEITGTDIDKSAIETARLGIYGEYAFNSTPSEYFKFYFKQVNTEFGTKYSLKKEIKDRVEFFEEDIIHGHKRKQKYDIIFCRNFFIYINRTSREKLLKVLENHLVNGGILVLGKTEMIMGTHTSFKLFDAKNHFYVKKDFSLSDFFGHLEKTVEIGEDEVDSKTKVKENKVKLDIADENRSRRRKRAQRIKVREKLTVKPIELNAPPAINVDIPKSTEIRPITPKVAEQVQEKKRSQPIKVTMAQLAKKQELQLAQKEFLLKQREMRIKQKELFFEEREIQLEKRDLILKQKERQLQNRELLIEEYESKLGRLEKRLNEQFSRRLQQEKKLKQQIEQLENMVKPVEHRAKQVEEREAQLEQLINELKGSVNEHSKPKENVKEMIKSESFIQVLNPNENGEIVVPKGYYTISKSGDNEDKIKNFLIPRLGTAIALLLKDPKNKIFLLAHASLQIFSQKHVKPLIRDLLNKILELDANQKHICAVIIGAANILFKQDPQFLESLRAIRKELNLLKINIEKEDIGGISERSIIFNITDSSLYIKKNWEIDFRRMS